MTKEQMLSESELDEAQMLTGMIEDERHRALTRRAFEELRASRATARATGERETLEYAQNLALVAAIKSGATAWSPLDDMMGVLSQIDNALTGLHALTPQPSTPAGWPTREEVARLSEQVEELKAELSQERAQFNNMKNREADALRRLAALKAGGVEGWRDIATAPRDGTPVLAWCPGQPPLSVVWGAYQYARGPFGGVENWRDPKGCPVAPTHWQPLPAAPPPQDQGPEGRG